MLEKVLKQHQQCFEQIGDMAAPIEKAGMLLVQTIESGGKILVCGNGGSAADAQHFAAELIGRFEQERAAWPAIALTTDTSILTAIGNDYGFEDIFARQVQGLGQPQDTLVGVSTSGNSENVLRAVAAAKSIGMRTIGLLGRDGGTLRAHVDRPVVISHSTTARVQEAHIFILHFWAMQIEHRIHPTP